MPVQGGRALLRIRLFGFPVHLDLSFVVIMAMLGYQPGASITYLVLWLLIATISVLVHELGHAFAARTTGAEPHIALAGFGGVTTYAPPHPLSRARSLMISLAGPMVGLVIGAALIVVQRGAGAGLDPSDWKATALRIGIFTSIGWSVLNLLPVIPLDGGQAMRELLPGAPDVRARRGAVVSVVVAALVAVAAYTAGQPFIALFMLFFGVSNLLALRRPDPGPAPRAEASLTPEQAVTALLWQGEPGRARELLATLPPEPGIDLAVHGAVMALTGQAVQGHALLAQELERRPGDANVAALLVLTLTLEHDWDALITTVQGPVGRSVPQPVIDRALAEARESGREDVAGRVSLLTRDR